MSLSRRSVRLAPLLGLSVALALLGVVAACATSDKAEEREGGERPIVVPSTDTGVDAPIDAAVGDVAVMPCAPGALCAAPLPLTHGYVTAISGRSKDDVWASGTGGQLLHWTGERWTVFELGIPHTISNIFLTPDELWGVAGALGLRATAEPQNVRTNVIGFVALQNIAVLPSGNAYVSVGPTTAKRTNVIARLNFDTAKLTYLPGPVLPWSNEQQPVAIRAGFLVPENALWLVGDQAAVARYPVAFLEGGGDASASEPGVLLPVAAQTNLLAAWGVGEQLWTAGTNGTLLHFDGTEWHTEEVGTTVTFNAIFGLSPTDIWVAGDDGTVLHFDGDKWSSVDAGGYRGSLMAIWASAPDDVWIGGERAMFHWGGVAQ
jgi:hypothetical protein